MNFRLFAGLVIGIVGFTFFLLWANTACAERYPAAAPFGSATYIALSVPARKPVPAVRLWMPVPLQLPPAAAWPATPIKIKVPKRPLSPRGINAHDLY